jgi:replicative DNA helicase
MSDVEKSVLAGVMNSQELATIAWQALTPQQHFTGAEALLAEACYESFRTEGTCEPNIVLATLISLGYARRYPGDRLFEVYRDGHLFSEHAFRRLVGTLEQERQRREVLSLANRLTAVAAANDGDLAVEVSELATALTLSVQTRQFDPLESALTVVELLNKVFEDEGEVVPGLFMRGTRVVVTGPEGRGKSELLWQIALGAARGMHPFTTEAVAAKRVLVIDGENELSQLQKRLFRINGMYDELGAADPGDNLLLQPALGWNLLDPRDAGHLLSMVREYKPDLLVATPVYQLVAADTNDAENVRRFFRVVDEARSISGCAFLTEAHSGHGDGNNRNAWRPTGSSMFLRWPDIGVGLDPLDEDGQSMRLGRWRGDRLQNSWPDEIRRGGFLPWTEIL